jgi:hypothetical protein
MKMKRILFDSLILFLISITLAGCNAETKPTQPGVNTSNTPVAIAETPAVSAEMGALRIVLRYSQNGEPVRSQNLYLAEMRPLQGATQEAYVPVLDMNTASRAESTPNGDVIMSLVAPGKYALAILTPVGSQLVVDSENNREITLDIKAGEITDLGIRKVTLDQEFLEPTIIP